VGCDIHSHAERCIGGRWVALDVKAFDDRNYGFFGWLANVRNYSAMRPIAANRGFPSDASERAGRDYHERWGTDAHSAGWVGVSELEAIDYECEIEDRRTTKQLAPNLWSGGETCEPGEGAEMTLREFLGRGFFEDLKRLKEAGAERVVFWFDN
jgi:hypothetical protein